MRILGIDPGLNLTGYGCLDTSDDSTAPKLLEAGVFRMNPASSMTDRLGQLHDDLTTVIDELTPQLMVVEKLFSHYRHVRTAILMGHARGVVLLAGQSRQVEIDELAVTEVKRAITGNGHASKQQMQLSIMQQCGMRELPEPPDVADAIALALCAARRMKSTVA